jgi:SAM-dependent methyltransferase
VDNNIIYREIVPGQEEAACRLVLECFDEFVAPGYSQQGIEEFKKYVNSVALKSRLQNYKSFVILAINRDQPVGIIEIRLFNHVSLFFVKKDFQRKGIAHELLNKALEKCMNNNPQLEYVDVNSSPYAVGTYERLGFIKTGLEQVINGIRFTPLKLNLGTVKHLEDYEVKQFYNTLAEKTADEWYNINILVPTIEDFLSLLPNNPKVLDLGCGPGYESMRMEARGARVLGIDFCDENIRIARERCPQCRFKLMDFRQLDNRFGTFDGIFASASIIHVRPEEMDELIRRLSEVLNKNGYLLIMAWDGEGLKDGGVTLEDGTRLNRSIYLYTKEAITGAAEKSGLRFVREGYLDRDICSYGWRCYIFSR